MATQACLDSVTDSIRLYTFGSSEVDAVDRPLDEFDFENGWRYVEGCPSDLGREYMELNDLNVGGWPGSYGGKFSSFFPSRRLVFILFEEGA